jgi:hypothetical protein
VSKEDLDEVSSERKVDASGVDTTDVYDLHQRALRGDSSAVDELIAHFLHVLQRRLARRFPRVSQDLIADGTSDALLEYAECPSRFDAARGIPLEGIYSTHHSGTLLTALRLSAGAIHVSESTRVMSVSTDLLISITWNFGVRVRSPE